VGGDDGFDTAGVSALICFSNSAGNSMCRPKGSTGGVVVGDFGGNVASGGGDGVFAGAAGAGAGAVCIAALLLESGELAGLVAGGRGAGEVGLVICAGCEETLERFRFLAIKHPWLLACVESRVVIVPLQQSKK